MKHKMSNSILKITFAAIFIGIIHTPLLATGKNNLTAKGDSATFSIPANIYRIKSIKKEKKLYIIYACKNDCIFKIVSIKDTIDCPKKQKIRRNKEYKLALESYFPRYDEDGMRLPHPGETGAWGLSFLGTTIDIEISKNMIWDLFRATNLNGLCIIGDE